MSDTHDGDQVHEATPVRLEQARRSGDVPRSTELAGAIHMVGTFIIALLFLGSIAGSMRDWTQDYWLENAIGSSVENSFGNSVGNGSVATQASPGQFAPIPLSSESAFASPLEPDSVVSELQSTMLWFAALLAPAMILMLAVSLLGHWGQTGVILRPQNMSPGENISGPSRWWKHVFSFKSISLPFLSIPKSAIAFVVAGAGCWYYRETIFSLGALPVEQLTAEISRLVLTVGLQVAVVLLVLSLSDYAIQRWSYAQRMQMTDQQLRDELRMQNGDPQISARRRHVHREILRR